jgi:hypothetical protein
VTAARVTDQLVRRLDRMAIERTGSETTTPGARNVTRATSDRTRSFYPQYNGAYRSDASSGSRDGRRLFRNRPRRRPLPVPCRNDHHPIAVVMRRLFVRRASPMRSPSPCATAGASGRAPPPRLMAETVAKRLVEHSRFYSRMRPGSKTTAGRTSATGGRSCRNCDRCRRNR